MSQKTVFGGNNQTTNQAQSEENLNETKPSLEDLIKELQPQIIVPSGRVPIKHLLIGCPKVVKSTIHYLHVIGYAEVGDWSPFSPNPNNTEEAMSMLVRNIRVQ